MSGKGSSRRPASVPRAEVDRNWERTFARKEPMRVWPDTAIGKEIPPETMVRCRCGNVMEAATWITYHQCVC